ncbi:monocarboxylate transporter 12-like [Amphiura filiformis]|uniref:monocarboxylate transporter 12-like n=1 Tax=Amphiura filiformis TaxID=82378 RepID=UPI003B21EF94
MCASRMKNGKDTGWSWLVCCGSVVAMFLETGMVEGLGLLLPVLREQFSSQTWVIGLIVSLVPGIGAVACILSGVLSEIVSHRFAMMVFGLLSSMGLILGSCATSIPMLLVSLLMTGFSVGAEAVTIATLPFFFDVYYDIANGIAHAGLSVGVMVMPLLSQYFLQVYGWRGTFLLFGGLNMHLLICAALLKPQQTQRKYISGTRSSLKTKDTMLDSQDTDSKVLAIIHRYVSLHLFTNIDFLCLLCIFTATGYYYIGWLIYFVPHCEEVGFTLFESSLLATVGGVGNLLGCIVFPVAASMLPGNVLLYLSALISFLALVTDPVMANIKSYVGLAVSSFAVNVGFAVSDCAIFKETVEVVEDGDVSNAVNWLFVGYSVGSVSSGFISGWFFDLIGDYATSFAILAAVAAFSISLRLVVDIGTSLKRRFYDTL